MAGTAMIGVVAALMLAVAAACGDGDGRQADTPAAAPPASGAPTGAPTHAGETARVRRVVDGDTILVEMNGREERVRYIGVNTPETVAPDRPRECYGEEASAANKRLVEGKTIRLERDVSERDQFGRLLRYVYVDGTFVNAELVRQGYATTVTFQPDVRENERLRTLEREARDARRGLWGRCR